MVQKEHIRSIAWQVGCILLAGCTAGPVEEFVSEEARPVALCFSKPDLGMQMVPPRAGETTVPAPALLPEGASVRILAYVRGYTGEQTSPISFSTTAPDYGATYVVNADVSLSLCAVDDNGKKTDGEAKNMVVRGGVYDFYAVSPARKLIKDSDKMYKIKNILHKEDMMTAFVRDVTVSQSSREVTLSTFKRKCAQVVFNVAPSPENVLPFSRLYANRLKVSKISSSGVDLIVGEDTGIPPTGGDADAVTQVEFGEEEFEPVESDTEHVGLNKTKGVLLPKNAKPFEVEIEVQRDDEQATLKATIDKSISFDEGKRYVFTLEVKNNESRLQMRVLDWNTISLADSNVGAPDKPYPAPDINEGIGTSFTVAVWKEIIWSGNGEVGGGK